MNYIEKILEETLAEKFKISLELYKQNVSKEEIEYDMALIEAGILACAKKVRT